MVGVELPNLTIYRSTKGKLPRLPFVRMKDDILGKKYELTIIFATPKKIQELNKTFRKKDYVPNILSFPLDKNSGEIYLCLSVIRNTAGEHDYNYKNFIPYLVIHGMLHLKGYEHGSTMDALEAKWTKHFNIFSNNLTSEKDTPKKNTRRN